MLMKLEILKLQLLVKSVNINPFNAILIKFKLILYHFSAYDISNLLFIDNESTASVISEGSSDEESDSDEPTNLEIFSKEVTQTLERAFSEGHTVEIASLELNTLRMASNTTFRDTRVIVIPTIWSQINTDNINDVSDMSLCYYNYFCYNYYKYYNN
jgi:hypothetical protein